MSIIKTSSERHSPSSLSLNTKSKLHTRGYETAGGSGVEGSVWVASHSGGGEKQMGIPRPLRSLATPTLPTSEADGGTLRILLGAGRPLHP